MGNRQRLAPRSDRAALSHSSIGRDELGILLFGVRVSPEERRRFAVSSSSRWGQRWILLPNPVHGRRLGVLALVMSFDAVGYFRNSQRSQLPGNAWPDSIRTAARTSCLAPVLR